MQLFRTHITWIEAPPHSFSSSLAPGCALHPLTVPARAQHDNLAPSSCAHPVHSVPSRSHFVPDELAFQVARLPLFSAITSNTFQVLAIGPPRLPERHNSTHRQYHTPCYSPPNQDCKENPPATSATSMGTQDVTSSIFSHTPTHLPNFQCLTHQSRCLSELHPLARRHSQSSVTDNKLAIRPSTGIAPAPSRPLDTRTSNGRVNRQFADNSLLPPLRFCRPPTRNRCLASSAQTDCAASPHRLCSSPVFFIKIAFPLFLCVLHFDHCTAPPTRVFSSSPFALLSANLLDPHPFVVSMGTITLQPS